MSQEEGKFDGILMQVIQTSQGIEGFFNEVFGFLRRKTDFFKDKKKAEEAIVKQCAVNYEKFTADQKELRQQEKEKKEREEKRKQEQEAKKKPEQKIPEKKEEKVEVKIPEKKDEEEKKDETQKEEKKEDDEKPPVGNGGATDRYVWTQTLEELVVRIPVENSIKGKECSVKMTPTHLTIVIKGSVFIDQDFTEKIKVEDSLWTLETDLNNEKYINLTLAKWGTEWHWWDSCLKGDAKINTQKISPEPSNLSDLDGETKGTVEKMMFDMRQKQMGKPSSDELKKQDMLSGFMKSHPEMDFSKCKFQ